MLHLVVVVVVVYLQHALSTVVRDAVTLQHVLDSAHLPGQPPLLEGGVDAEHVREVAGVTTTTALVILHSFLDSLHLSLLAVSPSELQATHLSRFSNDTERTGIYYVELRAHSDIKCIKRRKYFIKLNNFNRFSFHYSNKTRGANLLLKHLQK